MKRARLVLGSWLLAGCAAAAALIPLELTPWTPPGGQTCNAFGGDFPVSAIVDSSAAVAAVDRVGGSDGGLLLSVATDSTGALSRFTRIETSLPEREADALGAALEPLVRSPDAKPRSGRLLVEREDGRMARLAVGASEACRPAIANERVVQHALQQVWEEQRREGQIHAWLFVDTTGAVTESQIRRGTGDLAMDAAIIRAARTARFHPALRDRVPVPVWVALDFTVEVYCPPTDTVRWQLPADDPCRYPGRRR